MPPSYLTSGRHYAPPLMLSVRPPWTLQLVRGRNGK